MITLAAVNNTEDMITLLVQRIMEQINNNDEVNITLEKRCITEKNKVTKTRNALLDAMPKTMESKRLVIEYEDAILDHEDVMHECQTEMIITTTVKFMLDKETTR